jgi:hypothetical protein
LPGGDQLHQVGQAQQQVINPLHHGGSIASNFFYVGFIAIFKKLKEQSALCQKKMSITEYIRECRGDNRL